MITNNMDILFEITDLRRHLNASRTFQVDKLLIPRGGMVAVIGKSGSGKSTIAGILGGLTIRETSISGDVILNLAEPGLQNIDVFKRQARLRAGPIGFIFQTNDLIKNATISTNIALAIACAGQTIDRQILGDELTDLGIEDSTLLSKCRTLSGGEQQRTAFLRATMRSPELIIADEPTASLDSTRARELMQSLRDWCDKDTRRTVIWITHNLDEVSIFADSVVVFSNCTCITAKGMPAKNPKKPELLDSWTDGCKLEQMEPVQAKPDEPDTKLLPIRQRRRNILTSTGIAAKLAFNELMSGDHYRSDLTPKFIHQWQNMLTPEKVKQAIGNESIGCIERIRQIIRHIRHARKVFAYWNHIIGVVIIMCLFMVTSFGLRAMQHEFEETKTNPALSNVVLTGKTRTFELNENNLDWLKKEIASKSQQSSNKNIDVPLFGRHTSAGVEFRLLPDQKPVRKDGFFKMDFFKDNVKQKPTNQEIQDLHCKVQPRGPVANLLSIDRKENGIEFLKFSHQLRKNATIQFGKDHNDWILGQLHSVILKKSFVIEKLDIDAAVLVSKLICLNLKGWKIARIAAIVDEIEIDSGYSQHAIISNSFYHSTQYNNGLKSSLQEQNSRYETFAYYFNPDNMQSEIPLIKKIVQENNGLDFERGFEKMSSAIDGALFYQSIASKGRILLMMLIGFTLIVTVYSFLEKNNRSLVVGRAFGLNWWQLVTFLLVFIFTILISAAVMLLALMPLINWVIRAIELDRLPTTDLLFQFALFDYWVALGWTAGILFFVTVIASLFWWRWNSSIWHRLQRLA